MAQLNECFFIGRLGKDPEMSYTPSGKAVTKFTLAVDQGKQDKPMWLNITTWDKLAERVNTLLYKGAQVLVQGRLKISSYTDKNGIERLAHEIIANDVQLLEKKQTPDEQEKEP